MSSSRANSLRTVMLDSLYFAAVMGLLSNFTAIVAAGAEPVVERPAAGAVAPSVDNSDEPTGNPNQSPAAARTTNILGMKLLEERFGVVRVTDVAAASPAWDAGVRPGDRLTSIDGLKIGRLAPWVEDIAKLLDDKQDGHAVAAEIVRDGEPLDLRIRLLVSKADEAHDARKADEAMAKAAAAASRQRGQQQLGPLLVAVGRPDGDPYYDRYPGYGSGLAGFFGDGDDGITSGEDPNDDRMANRAIAHLSAVNTVAGRARGQVGIAAFRTSGQGVATMVAVRGLPQGSYVVGIDDGSALAGGVDAGFGVGDDVGADRDLNDPTMPSEIIGYGGPGSPQFLREIGVLHVGPDGVGQLQNQLDGVEVRHLAGLHVTVASTMSRGGAGFGPRQQGPTQTGTDPRVAQPSQNLPGRTTADPQTSNPQTSQQRAAASAAAANPGPQGAPGVVATGVIQLVDDRGGLGLGGAFGDESRQGERPVDEATREQRERSQISDPREQFDGSNPQEQFEGSNPQEQFDSSDLNGGNE